MIKNKKYPIIVLAVSLTVFGLLFAAPFNLSIAQSQLNQETPPALNVLPSNTNIRVQAVLSSGDASPTVTLNTLTGGFLVVFVGGGFPSTDTQSTGYYTSYFTPQQWLENTVDRTDMNQSATTNNLRVFVVAVDAPQSFPSGAVTVYDNHGNVLSEKIQANSGDAAAFTVNFAVRSATAPTVTPQPTTTPSATATLTYSVFPSTAGYCISMVPAHPTSGNPSGSFSYPLGTNVQLAATPFSVGSYVFDHWEIDGLPVSASNPTTVPLTQNRHAVAYFRAPDASPLPTPVPSVSPTQTVSPLPSGSALPLPSVNPTPAPQAKPFYVEWADAFWAWLRGIFG